jgi:pyridoxamine 5'-phosphate oxidase family protein
MSVFTPAEITYLQSQRLARVATSGPGGQPHVVPVSFRYNPDEDTIDFGGHGFAQRKKYRDVQRNPRVAIVINDLADWRRGNRARLRFTDLPHPSQADRKHRYRRG